MLFVAALNITHDKDMTLFNQNSLCAYCYFFLSISCLCAALSKMLNVVALNIKHCASGHDIIQSDFFVPVFH